MAQISLPSSELLGLVLEAILYGIYFVLFLHSMYFLVGSDADKRRGARAKVSTHLITAANVILFSCVTGQLIIETVRVYKAFIDDGNEPNGPMQYFSKVSQILDVARLSLYAIEGIISDCIMVYRLWMVWYRSVRIILFPACTTIAGIVFGILFTWNLHHLTPGVNFFDSACAPWIAAALASTVGTTLYCSAFISYKIWSSERAVRHVSTYLRSTVASQIVMIIVESALLFTVSSLAVMITFFAHSYSAFATINMAAPLDGLSYSLIIVRFGMGGAFQNKQPPQQVLSTVNLPSGQSGYSSRSVASSRKPISINVSHDTEMIGMNDLERGPKSHHTYA